MLAYPVPIEAAPRSSNRIAPPPQPHHPFNFNGFVPPPPPNGMIYQPFNFNGIAPPPTPPPNVTTYGPFNQTVVPAPPNVTTYGPFNQTVVPPPPNVTTSGPFNQTVIPPPPNGINPPFNFNEFAPPPPPSGTIYQPFNFNGFAHPPPNGTAYGPFNEAALPPPPNQPGYDPVNEAVLPPPPNGTEHGPSDNTPPSDGTTHHPVDQTADPLAIGNGFLPYDGGSEAGLFGTVYYPPDETPGPPPNGTATPAQVEERRVIAKCLSDFNDLPRLQIDPQGPCPNHWHFSLQRTGLNPPDTLLVLVNSHGRHHVARLPREEMPPHRQVLFSAMLLMRAFSSKNLGESRPWSWSTDSPVYGNAVAGALRQIGVGEGLQYVGTTGMLLERIAREVWMDYWVSLLGSNFGVERTEPQRTIPPVHLAPDPPCVALADGPQDHPNYMAQRRTVSGLTSVIGSTRPSRPTISGANGHDIEIQLPYSTTRGGQDSVGVEIVSGSRFASGLR
ncbi:collagen, type [Pseudocyphellaria aurata]|nr:collagen, type [Pseudocyphellaria aurata]